MFLGRAMEVTHNKKESSSTAHTPGHPTQRSAPAPGYSSYRTPLPADDNEDTPSLLQFSSSPAATTLRHGARTTGTNIPYAQPQEEDISTTHVEHDPQDPIWWSFNQRRIRDALQRRNGTLTETDKPRTGVPQIPARNVTHSTPNPTKSTEEIFTNMAASITTILQQLADRDKQQIPARRVIPYEYSAKIEEDPVWFLQKLDEYFEQRHIHDDTEKILVTGEQLKGKAKQWYENYVDIAATYNEFKHTFLAKYDSPEEWAAARAVLYGEEQRSNENTEKFLTYKKKLFARLDNQINLYTRIRVLLKQLKPDIRSRMRGLQFNTMEDFIAVATEIETDLQEHDRKMQTPATRYKRPEERHLPEPLPRTRNTEPPVAPPRQATSGSAQPPTACRFCGEWHYHSVCPRNPYRHLNGQRAADRQPPQSAPQAQPRSRPQQQQTATSTSTRT